jgi:hypothetical protein
MLIPQMELRYQVPPPDVRAIREHGFGPGMTQSKSKQATWIISELENAG